MKLNDFIEGINILRPRYNKPDGYHLGAEHDQIYLYATDLPLAHLEAQRMFELGWFQPESKIVDGSRVNDYDEKDGWSTYV